MKKTGTLLMILLLCFISCSNKTSEVQDHSAPLISFISDTAVIIQGKTKDFITFYDDTELSETFIDDVTQLEDGMHEVCAYAVDTSKNQASLCQTMRVIHYEQILDYDYENITVEELIQELLTAFQAEDSVSITYENMTTSQTYNYQSERFMNAASTIKLPLNMIYYDRIKQGEYQEDSLLYYGSAMQEDGAGDTQYEYAPGDFIPLSYLLHQSIVYSDNTAANILIQELGFSSFRLLTASFYEQAYPEQFYKENLVNGTLLHACLKQLYENADYDALLSDMKQAMPNAYFKKYLTDIEVAHKYGSYNGYAHDCGIIYADEPFLLTVMCEHVSHAEELISTIALALYEYQLLH